MPKRRATQTAAESDSEGSGPRRRRLNDEEGSDDGTSSRESPGLQSATQTNLKTMISKLVRLALSAEYSRIPIRRTDISAKVLGDAGGRQFKAVFEGAQMELQSKFGMQMVELPGREKDRMGNITQRRAAASQASQKSKVPTASSWTLISILPPAYKHSPKVTKPTRAPSLHAESTYTALYTFIVSLILLSPTDSLPEAKIERYLKRVNADSYTPIGQTEKVIHKLVRDGYLIKGRDTSTGEEIIEYSVGPRGKMEVGADGVSGLVRKVYEGEDASEELERKLNRSLGHNVKQNGADSGPAEVENADQAGSTTQQTQVGRPRRRGRPRRGGSDDDND